MIQRNSLFFLMTLLLTLCKDANAQTSNLITSFYAPKATGNLSISVRNDSLRFVCPEISVNKGEFQSCDSNPIFPHDFFIKRNEIEKSWLSDVARGFSEFPDVSGSESTQKWFFFEERRSNHFKEDFTSVIQKSGITYRHHESKKGLISYSMANPNGKVYQDLSKYHCLLDMEENIKGKYESYYLNGKKAFRHKYLINRFLTYAKDVKGTKSKSSMEINLTGTIEEYYENGKKKGLVTYTDLYTIQKKEEDKERKVLKTDRTGVKKKFYETGKLFSRGEFGMKGFVGEVEYYSKKGKVIKVEKYDDGVLNGKFVEYFVNGDIKVKGGYKKGKKVGKWETFNEAGELVSSIKF